MTSLTKHWQRKQSSERGNCQVLDASLWGKLGKFKNLRRTRRTRRTGRKRGGRDVITKKEKLK
jgi:hypothetical protein